MKRRRLWREGIFGTDVWQLDLPLNVAEEYEPKTKGKKSDSVIPGDGV